MSERARNEQKKRRENKQDMENMEQKLAKLTAERERDQSCEPCAR